jgi:iron complex outermembrane recepter protein
MGVVLVCGAGVVANAATPTTATNPPDEAVVLSPFEVTTTTDNSYVATNAATGTRIAVPLVQLPFTASVITSAFIEDRGAINLTEATRFVPSLRRGTNNNEAFTLRGFNSGVPRRNYFSNVGAGRSRTDNAEIERIEVIKGPTSVLFGFGGPGGVINVLTKKPLGNPAYSLSAEYGSFDHRRLTADATGPLLSRGESQLRYRVIGTRQRSKGYRDFERYDQSFLNTQLQWANRQTTARVEFRFQDLDEGETFILQPFDEPSGTVIPTERSFNVAGPEAFARYKEISTYYEFTHTFTPGVSLRAAAVDGDHYFNALRRVGASVTPDFLNTILTGNKHDDKRQLRGWQVDLSGQGTFRLGKARLVVGANEQQTHGRIRTYSNAQLPQRNFPILNRAARNYSTGLAADYLPQASGFNNDTSTDRVYYAIGSLETLRERLTLFAGVGRMESDTSTWGIITAAAPTLGRFVTTEPQLGASLRITPGLHVFANFTQSASPNARFPDTPESGDGMEFGVKASREKMSGSVTFFDSSRENIQVSIFNNLTAGSTFELSGEESSRGIEAEFQLNPNEQLQLIGAYSLLDTEVVSDRQRPDRVGTELANAPEHSLRLWTKYQLKGGPLDKLWMGLGYLYTSDLRPGDNPARFRLKADSWFRLDAAVGYTMRVAGRRVDWRANFENLTNEDYIGVALHRGAPFTAKLSALLRF